MRRAMRMALMRNNNGGATNRRRRDSRGRYMEGDYGARSEFYDAQDRRMRNDYGGRVSGDYDFEVYPRQDRQMGFAYDMNDNDIRRRNTGGEDGWFSEQGEDMRYPTSRYGTRRMAAGGHQGGMHVMKGHASGQMHMPKPLDRDTAEEWVEMMDGESQGETWSFEEIKEIAKKHGLPEQEHKIVELYAVMNMLASDYYKVAEKFDVLNDDFFVCMAKAFIHDEDAVPDKVAAYYQYIVKKD